jgi:hypothetical protein
MYYEDIGLDDQVTDFNPAAFGPKYPGPRLYGLGAGGDDDPYAGQTVLPEGSSGASWWETIQKAAPGIQTGLETGFKTGAGIFGQYQTQFALPQAQARQAELAKLKALREEQLKLLSAQYGSALERTGVTKEFTGWKTWAIVGVLALVAFGGFTYFKKRGV